jgi:cbb3-type cytochrome oxidase subunit 1
MERHVLGFLRASLAWLLAGVTLGAAMAMAPSLAAYRTAHLHMLLLGFVTMMIAGVAYHVFPRFAATPLHSTRMARAHFVAANAGLLLMVAGFVVRVHQHTPGTVMLATGGTLSAVGAYLLAINLWRTLDHAAVMPSRLPPIRPRPMPVAEPGLHSTPER